jgi:adenylate cyclase
LPTYTASQLAETVGIPEADTRRFFRALGFPDSGEEIRYTEEDRRVLSTVVRTLTDSEVDLATGVRLVRAVGQNVARMSDWQVAALASLADENPSTDHSKREVTARMAGEVTGAMELVLAHAWRRHLDAAIDRIDVDAGVEDPEDASCVTVGFADLVNFTALSNEMDSDRLGELVEIFEARSGDVVSAHEGRMIKTIGDAVLFVAEDADRAMDIACGLIDVIGEDSRLPDVRIGLATGLVVTRLGDVFGPPVNLAARLTALARRNRVIADDATVDSLVNPGYEMRRLTARPLRGFGLVEPVAVRRC